MSVQLFAKLQDSQTYINIDLSANEPIKMVLSVQNIEDPLATTSAFSRTFKVPHTGVNGPYFKGVFNVNSVDFDAAKRADAYILDNGQFFANGQIVLNTIYRNEKEKNVEYEITFLGETSDFGAKIGGGFMNEINMSHLNHAKDYQNINTSWTNGLFNGDVVYGLIEWGYTYNANNQPVQPTLSNGFQKSFTNTNNPLRLSQWKPQYRAKAIWDQIFKEAGYTYDSTFLDSSIFKQLYIISDNVSSAELNTANTFDVNNAGSLGNLSNDSFPIDYTTKNQDPGNNFSLPADSYTAPVSGLYEFVFNAIGTVGSYFDNFQSSVDGSIEWIDQNGMVLANIPFGIYNQGSDGYGYNSPSSTISGIVQLQLNQGDVVSMRCVVGPGQPYAQQYFTLSQPSWGCTLAPQVLSATGILPRTIKKIDFMKSIINRFRLVFVPSRDIQNHFTITPWKDWILEGKVRDWTSKLDDSKDLKIRPLFQGQSRFQVYKDQEDADYLNYGYQLTYKQPFGQLNFDSQNELLTGSKQYLDQFAPTPIAPIGFKEGDIPGSQFLIPHMAKDTGGSEDTVGTTVISGKREPIQPKLRLVFYNGMVPAPVNWWMATDDTNINKVERTTYPLMSQYNQWPVTATTLDLSWRNEEPFWKTTDPYLGTGLTALSSYNVYWKTWNDQVFDPYSRMVDANITLDYNDILDLKFNDYIFLKDSWYIVNKINDYIPGKITNCRVELVKLGNIGVTIPNIAPVVYIPVQLCRSNTATPCQVFCCNNQVTESVTYYIPEGTSFATTTVLYLDQTGTIFAPAGIYSDGVNINEFDANGILVATYDPALCNCIPTFYTFELIRVKSEPCDICCGIATQSSVVAYGLNPIFELNTLLWLDTAMTVPIPGGWYSDTATIDIVVQFLGGASQVTYNCDTCNCISIPVFLHTVRFHPDQVCRACRCGTIVTVWTDNATWADSTVLYSNNLGTIPAAIGFYNYSGWYLETDITGDVINSNNCPSCISCKDTIDFPIDIVVFRQGYTTSVTLESSDDRGANWTVEGVVSILPGDSVTTKSETLQVPVGDIFRITSTSDTINGGMTSDFTSNGSLEEQKTVTPGSIITNYDLQVASTDALSFVLTVAGGEFNTNNDIIVGGGQSKYKGTGFPPNTTTYGIMGLKENGDVNTDFSVGTGFQQGGGSDGTVWAIKKIGTQFLIAGQFAQYKNVDCTNSLIILNPDGSIDNNFNSQVGVEPSVQPDPAVIRTVDVLNGIAYAAGEFKYWDRAPLGSTTPDLYTASPRMVAINIANGTLNTGFNAEFDITPGIFLDINIIKIYEGKIYVGGNMQKYGSDTRRWLYRLNLDGTLDTSFDATHLGGNVYDFEFDGDYIWVATDTSSGGKVKKILKSNGSAVTWTPVSFLLAVRSIEIVGDVIYCGGTFITSNGGPANRIIALNKSDGSVYTPFNVGSGFNNTVTQIVTSGAHLYCVGSFTTYKDVTANRIAKIDLATGAVDTSFVTGSGFDDTTFTLLADAGTDINYNCNSKLLNYSATSACDAFCNFTIGNQEYWINSPDLISASLILTSTECGPGGNGNAAGYYSDGVIAVEVGSGGVIINTIDISTCMCGGGGNKVYLHNVREGVGECEACCSNGLIDVYTDSELWSESGIMYYDSTGTTFAPVGWYAKAGTLLYVGNNGAILINTYCQCDCPPQPCASWRIRNLSGSVINYTYTDCGGFFFFGDISAYSSINTTCTELSNISVTGNFTIIQGAIC